MNDLQMNDLQAMQERMAQLEQETMQLREETLQLREEALALKSNSRARALRQRFVFGLAIVGIGLAVFTHNGNTQGNGRQRLTSLTTQEIKVVDADNNVVLWLSPTQDGEGQISAFNGAAKKVISISATSDTGAGTITVNDEDGRKKAQIYAAQGKGYVWTQK